MPFVDLSDLKGKANAARSSVARRFDANSAKPASRNATPAHAEHASTVGSGPSSAQVDFTHPAEKQALHSLLDTYFSRKIPSYQPPAAIPVSSDRQPGSRTLPPRAPDRPTPPPVNSATRPGQGPRPPSQSVLPSASSHLNPSCEARKLAEFFSPSASWAASPEWFSFDRVPPNSQPIPPPLEKNGAIKGSSWAYQGSKKWLTGADSRHSPIRNVVREIRWADPPSPWDGGRLYEASVTYGELLAQFAENAERNRIHIGRGECWDLANEGLKSVATQIAAQGGGDAGPMPSIGRTHGHLLFTSVAGQQGTWRGGENAIRRGDVVQWLRTSIKLVGQPAGGSMILGDPDHTAVVVSDTSVAGIDGGNMGPDGTCPLHASAIGPLEVVEQSRTELPVRRTYDMTQFTAGQVWIYRPVSMLSYLGVAEIAPTWPPPLSPSRLHSDA
ncbi:hypothetical protein DL93DRAFT_2095598 [Clavulina sp. PMI_390]|nr:hypothetical protein DL93DRAFT_2095598 [Clavulina sp. PMI_390]